MMQAGPDQAAADSRSSKGQIKLALLSAGAALLGAIVGGLAAFGAGIYQANAQHDLALRQDREAAYAQMLQAFTNFNAAEGAFSGVMAKPGDPQYWPRTNNLCARSGALETPYLTVQIVGTNTVIDAAGRAAGEAAKECRIARAVGEHEVCCQVSPADYFEKYDAFLTAARQEISH